MVTELKKLGIVKTDVSDLFDYCWILIMIFLSTVLLNYTRFASIDFFASNFSLILGILNNPLLTMTCSCITMASILIQIQEQFILIMNSKKYEDNNVSLLQRKNKAIKDCKDKYDKIVCENAKISDQNVTTLGQIQQQCQRLNQTLAKLKLKSQQYMSNCLLAITEQKKNAQVTCVSQLATYLKIEKQLLKSITDQKEQQKPSTVDLHVLLGKVQLEGVLRRLKKEQLEQQIKFIESNVIVKGNFIYNPTSSLLISLSQEKESLARMHNLVDQLERVIKLSIPCATNANNHYKLALLTSQQARINSCQRILQEQHSKVMKYTKFIEDMASFQQRFSYGEPYTKEAQIVTEMEDDYQQRTVSVDELNEVLQMKSLTPIVINFEHPFTILESNIAQLRGKIKKIQNYLS